MATANFRKQKDFKLYVITDDHDWTEEDVEMFREDFEHHIVNDFNEELDWFEIQLKSGYYAGVQLFVEPLDTDRMEFIEACDNDSLESEEIEEETLKINETILPRIARLMGFYQIKVVAQASNGETFYEKVLEKA